MLVIYDSPTTAEREKIEILRLLLPLLPMKYKVKVRAANQKEKEKTTDEARKKNTRRSTRRRSDVIHFKVSQTRQTQRGERGRKFPH